MNNSARKILVCAITILHCLGICLVGHTNGADNKYAAYSNARFSYSISYPADLLIPQGEADNGDGQRFLSRDKRAEMLVYGSYALDRSLRDLYEIESQGDKSNTRSKKTVTYTLLRSDRFVVSGRIGDRVFYQKTIRRGDVFKTFRIEYDKSLKGVFDEVTKKVSASFKG